MLIKLFNLNLITQLNNNYSQLKLKKMIKELLMTALAVLVALVVYDLIVKKFVIKSDFEEAFDEA